MKENTDLVQIRPAFGGNIMAQIVCTNTRPQISTVRYKGMNAPERQQDESGKITICEKDMAMVEELAELLHAQIAGTRKLVEAG